MIYDINTGEELDGGQNKGDEAVARLTRQVADLTELLSTDDTKDAVAKFVEKLRVLDEALKEALRSEPPVADDEALTFEKLKNLKMWESTSALNRKLVDVQVTERAKRRALELRIVELEATADAYRVALREAEAQLGSAPRTRGPNHEDQSRFARSRRAAAKLGRDWTLVESVYDTMCDLPCRFCGGDTGRGIGLGRTDLTVGFVEGNVFPCCGRCGRIRGDRYTVDEMVELVGRG